jgi:hypothetical protein
MSKQHFGVGLVHGVIAMRSGTRLPQIADAFDVAEVIGAAADQHALLISNVPQQFRADLETGTLFSDPARISNLAMAHHRILQAAAVVTDVAPIRLGTLVTGQAGAWDLLSREASRFADALAAIRNTVEFAVRILPAQHPTRQVSRIDAGSGREYLRARRDERASSRPAVVDIVLRELADRAVAIHERQPGSRQPGRPPPVADAAFLVDRRKLAAFAACAGRIERQIAGNGLALDVFGPLPAYSFVDSRLEDRDDISIRP